MKSSVWIVKVVVIAFKPASKAFFFCSFMFSGVELHVFVFLFFLFFYVLIGMTYERAQLK